VTALKHEEKIDEELHKITKAYQPLALLMERARQIPLESVWPPRSYVAPTQLQDQINQLDQRVRLLADARGGRT
jgi:hypothetical protein